MHASSSVSCTKVLELTTSAPIVEWTLTPDFLRSKLATIQLVVNSLDEVDGVKMIVPLLPPALSSAGAWGIGSSDRKRIHGIKLSISRPQRILDCVEELLIEDKVNYGVY